VFFLRTAQRLMVFDVSSLSSERSSSLAYVIRWSASLFSILAAIASLGSLLPLCCLPRCIVNRSWFNCRLLSSGVKLFAAGSTDAVERNTRVAATCQLCRNAASCMIALVLARMLGTRMQLPPNP
jgi:hypothetical protein